VERQEEEVRRRIGAIARFAPVQTLELGEVFGEDLGFDTLLPAFAKVDQSLIVLIEKLLPGFVGDRKLGIFPQDVIKDLIR
jgi:hypothetical protein